MLIADRSNVLPAQARLLYSKNVHFLDENRQRRFRSFSDFLVDILCLKRQRIIMSASCYTKNSWSDVEQLNPIIIFYSLIGNFNVIAEFSLASFSIDSVNVLTDVMLCVICNEGRASPVGLHDLLQWAVGLQQQ